MFGLTTLGAVHTAISLVALLAGALAFLRYGAITLQTRTGQWYLWATVLTCLTGFGIFQHGGFGKPHILGVVTLLVLGLVVVAGRRTVGRAAAYVETIGFSLSYFFHWIPGLTETFTRVPLGAPLFSGPDDPALQKAVGVAFLVFLVGAAWQVRVLRARRGQAQRVMTGLA